MPRHDLLALSPDDLTALSNRGIVKRAQQEVEAEQLTCEIVESAEGAVTARWSDEVECTLGAADTLAEAQCSCPANSLCRHIIRTVLEYQRQAGRAAAIGEVVTDSGPTDTQAEGAAPQPTVTAEAPAVSADAVGAKHGAAPTVSERETTIAGETPNTTENQAPALTGESAKPDAPSVQAGAGPSAVWNPGDIDDAQLAQFFSKKVLASAKRQFEDGHVLELVRAAKPSARNHTLGFHLRFLVSGDPRYVYCDCSEPPPCSHVPLTVWAFRLLAPDREAGLVSTRPTALPTPAALFDEIENCLGDLAFFGLANLPAAITDRLRRLEARCREEGLIWPAEILGELVLLREAYARRDARFASAALSELLAEICIRMDAIRADTGAAPQLFLRGAKSDQPTEIGMARLIGLGCAAETFRSGVRLSSYLQDSTSGMIVAVRRDYPNPPEGVEEAAPFRQLAQSPVFKGVNLAVLGRGQMLVKGGKRSPNHEFHFGRAPVNVNPQSYQWESLRPPALASSFREIASRLTAQPPPPLRPRRIAEGFHVCPIAAVSGARFDPVEQAVIALLEDPEGGTAVLSHPFTGRGAQGAEALLALLTDQERAATVRYAAGSMCLRGGALTLAPVSLVTERQGRRDLIQPWIESAGAAQESGADAETSALPSGISGETDSPVDRFRNRLMEEAGELLLTGLERSGDASTEQWREIVQQAEALGFVHFVRSPARLVAALDSKRHTVKWDPLPAGAALAEVVCAALLMQTV